MKLHFKIIISFLLLASSPSFANEWESSGRTPSDVYAKVHSLNQGLASLLRQNADQLSLITIKPELLKHEIRPRHVFQRALDIEFKLTSLLKLNGIHIEQTETIDVRTYTPREVFNLIDRLSQHAEKLLSNTGIESPDPRKIVRDKKPADVYNLLDRMDGFLLKMGTPSTQPAQVLRRAQMIRKLAQLLCSTPKCKTLGPTPLPENSIITPLHVYQETYQFIDTLADYVQHKGINVNGGILALPVERTLIAPMHVNRIMGIALADLIAIVERAKVTKNVSFEALSRNDVLPREVWQEIHFARELLEQSY